MKTIRKLKTLDWSGCFFKEMVNVLDIQPEYSMINDFKSCKDSSTIFNMCYREENSVIHGVFNNIECIFSDKNNKMLHNCVSIVDQLKEEIWSFVGDEYWDEIFIVVKDFMRFTFKTDEELVYNQRINIPVCVISLSCILKRGDVYYPQFRLQDCFDEN